MSHRPDPDSDPDCRGAYYSCDPCLRGLYGSDREGHTGKVKEPHYGNKTENLHETTQETTQECRTCYALCWGFCGIEIRFNYDILQTQASGAFQYRKLNLYWLYWYSLDIMILFSYSWSKRELNPGSQLYYVTVHSIIYWHTARCNYKLRPNWYRRKTLKHWLKGLGSDSQQWPLVEALGNFSSRNATTY